MPGPGIDPQTGTREVLIEGGTNAQYSPTGHLLWVEASGTVFARPFDLASRDWTGSAEPVESGVRIGVWGGGAGYDASNTGVLAWITGSEFETDRMVILDRAGKLAASDKLSNLRIGGTISLSILLISSRAC